MPSRVQQEVHPSERKEEEVAQDYPGNKVGEAAIKGTCVHEEALDILIDEIDNLLESDSKRFVDGFRQVGGQ